MNNSEYVLAFLAKTLLAQTCLICKSHSAELACDDCSSLLCNHCGKEHGCGKTVVNLRQLHIEQSETITTPQHLNSSTPQHLNPSTSQPFIVSKDSESDFVDLDQVEDLKEEVSLQHQQIDSLNSIINQLKTELFLSKSEIDRLKEKHIQVVSDLKERLSLKENETVSLSVKLREANEQIEYLEEKVKQEENKSLQHIQKENNLLKQNQLLQDQINQLKETPQALNDSTAQQLNTSIPESDINECSIILRTGLIWSGLLTAMAFYRLSIYISDPRGMLTPEGQNCLIKAISI